MQAAVVGSWGAARWPRLDQSALNRHDVPVVPRPAAGHRGTEQAGQSHEETLLRLLYEEHAGPLLAFVLRLTDGDRQRAEDVVQETLLRAWRNAHRLNVDGQRPLRPWLVTVARRIAIDDYRSDRARPAETGERELEHFAVADETDRVLRSVVMKEALAVLSHAHREILLETYFRGRTVAEAAETLGLPLGTAKSRLYYGMHALREALAQRGVTGS